MNTPEDEKTTPEQEIAAAAGHPTANPDGITSSNYPYWPRTQEEKALGLGVEMATTTVVPETEPYPVGDPPNADSEFDMLTRAHSPMELVPSDEWQTTAEKNLAAGGSVELDEARALRTDLDG